MTAFRDPLGHSGHIEVGIPQSHEDQADLIAGIRCAPDQINRLVAGQGCFIGEILPGGQESIQLAKDLPARRHRDALRSEGIDPAGLNIAIDELAGQFQGVEDRRLPGTIGATEDGTNGQRGRSAARVDGHGHDLLAPDETLTAAIWEFPDDSLADARVEIIDGNPSPARIVQGARSDLTEGVPITARLFKQNHTEPSQPAHSRVRYFPPIFKIPALR